jgi:hypothetical protein
MSNPKRYHTNPRSERRELPEDEVMAEAAAASLGFGGRRAHRERTHRSLSGPSRYFTKTE